ncbi:hypothetical protein [Cryobacterium sp. TMT4-31]|uniref:hypothetical protein n=1 Tax=Cryobacterium sp. TMT4-31 TaxID=1259259 RepID=UPI00106CAFC3|nr:hypothetical protein [Cryobacterium sp. TMT4-31]TFC87459.1 hypothetical protein E3T19_12555 [Cryobacterium sp. TMT4-31]
MQKPDAFSASFRLAIAVLLQQLVHREMDTGSEPAAFLSSREVLEWLPRGPMKAFDHFQVSRGISWGPSRTQADIAESVRVHAQSAMAYSDANPMKDLWVKVVRGRSGWADARMTVRAASRDSAVLRDLFESEFESTSGKRVFMRSTAGEIGIDALLISELAGDFSRTRSNREELAKIHLIEHPGDDFYTGEALRLLRHARASSTLQVALRRVRAEGPDQSLKRDAHLILHRPSEIGVSEQDLQLLDYAADYLEPAELRTAIDLVWRRLGDSDGLETNWSNLDRVWKTVGRLLPGSSYDQQVAQKSSVLLSHPELLSPPFSNTFSQLVETIDWASVGAEAKAVWTSFAVRHGQTIDSNADLERVLRAIRENVNGEKGVGLESTGVKLAAYLADNGSDDPLREDEFIHVSAANLVLALNQEADQANKGIYSFGGLDTCNVAVAFALRFENADVWRAVLEHLTNPRIDGVLKAQGLDRIARYPNQIPADVVQALTLDWQSILTNVRSDGFFVRPSTKVFAEAVRAGASLKIMPEVEVLGAIVSMMSEGDTGKVQAARTISFAIREGDSTWAHALLLQLSHEANPDVKFEAGQSLIRTSTAGSLLQKPVIERIGELLESEGIRIPIRMLYTFQDLAPGTYRHLDELLPKVYLLSTEAAPRVVRGAAKEAIRVWNSRQLEELDRS